MGRSPYSLIACARTCTPQVYGVCVKRRETIRGTPLAAPLDSSHASAKAASPVTASGKRGRWVDPVLTAALM